MVLETNPLLRDSGSFTVEGYRDALRKMEKFFSGLKAEVIFQTFESEPGTKEWEKITAHADRNVKEARYYFRLKLITLSVLEALAGTIGKDLEVPVLMGELSNLGPAEDNVQKFLPDDWKSEKITADRLEHNVLELLQKTTVQGGYSLKASPLAAFLVVKVGFRRMLALWETSQAFLDGKCDRKRVLKEIPNEITTLVSEAITKALQSRAHHLSDLASG